MKNNCKYLNGCAYHNGPTPPEICIAGTQSNCFMARMYDEFPDLYEKIEQLKMSGRNTEKGGLQTMEEVVRNGIERFYSKYPEYPRVQIQQEPEYLGVGAPMIDPKELYRDRSGQRI